MEKNKDKLSPRNLLRTNKQPAEGLCRSPVNGQAFHFIPKGTTVSPDKASPAPPAQPGPARPLSPSRGKWIFLPDTSQRSLSSLLPGKKVTPSACPRSLLIRTCTDPRIAVHIAGGGVGFFSQLQSHTFPESIDIRSQNRD